MLDNGFIKIHRSMLKWEWYDDIITKAVFLHLLLTVSIEDSKWHGMTIKRGSRIISYNKLAKEMKLSVRNVRTALNHLKMTNEVTIKSTPHFSVITVNNYDKYQKVTHKTANNRQTADKQPTHARQQYKKVKEDIKKIKEDKEAASPGFVEPPGLLPGGEFHINEGGDF